MLGEDALDSIDPVAHAAGWVAAWRDTRDAHRMVVAVRGAEIVGFVYVADGVLEAIHVAPEEHGRGIGRALMAAAKQALHEMGLRRATLWVLEGNDGARRFYERDGWSLTGQVREELMYGVPTRMVQYGRVLDR